MGKHDTIVILLTFLYFVDFLQINKKNIDSIFISK